jgi:hypothetical protein
LWEQCYSILRTSLLFLDAAELGPIEAYQARIKKYAMENPPEVWHLIYQADHRMRKEHMERIQRKGEMAKALDASHPFDPSAPWKWVWAEAAINEDKFWKTEFESPSVLIISHVKKVRESLDGDASIAGDRNTSDTDLLHTTPQILPGIQAPPRQTTLQDRQHPPPPHREPKRQKTETESKAVYSNGQYSTNKKGLELCNGYQDGSCPATSHSGRCPKNSDRVHQCCYCLSAHAGTACPKNGGGGKKWGSGKRKGKGRGKGKGGKGD